MAYDYKKPQSFGDPASKWNNEGQAYDGDFNDQATCADSVAGPADLDPWVRFYNWQTKGFPVYSATFLYVNWKTNGSYSNDRFAIKYTKDGGTNWLDLVPLAIHNETNIQLSGAELDSNQDLTLVQVKLVYDRVGGADTGITYIYDIWSRGSASYEDFTTYTEVDGSNRLSQTTTRSTWTALKANETAYLYKDKTADHFNGDFEHLLDVRITSIVVNAWTACWVVSNSLNTVADGQLDVVGIGDGVGTVLYLEERYGGSSYYDSYSRLSTNTTYYLKIKRDEGVGANGTLYCYIYSDSARTNLLDTLTVALHAKVDFQYIYGVQSWGGGTSAAQTGYCENLDLQEGWTGKLMGVTNPAKICGVAVANISKVMGVS